jgi:pyruvate ferredoxin oxidoreductase alpha subunit
MGVVNRALNAPLNIHCDHTDTMGARDSGWIQLFSENAQEAYDNTIMAFRIAENEAVNLPCMVTLDGFILSHTQETLELLEDGEVRSFVGDYKPRHYLLNANAPILVGPVDLQDWLFEHKRANIEATRNVPDVMREVSKNFFKLSGRSYDSVEAYRTEDAELVAIVLGSTAGTAKEAVDELRERGVAAGVVKIRLYRPFPGAELFDAMPKAKAVAVLDRSIAFGLGSGGPVFHEVRSWGYELGKRIPIINYLYGIGGRDVSPEHITEAFDDLREVARSGDPGRLYRHLNLRD